ncbi:hypothetical protein ASPVEDRAFT_48898 [Aspergillus versicolor CBS 583.65]|uniref:Uncharacterized protein n=1 Tax=Aspergillus versicolor CBS 583.65 TaxID=1036611 RepID=A0A1L9P5K0_ASPVE|nr:uncharacterized protein ASPVEDRAFT_48898 [Aspergillus versicolor CBS 583.65]OJI96790.1 hypothetical protein ASPVEDRAFT_48898 [Aspergillus versicolor CBS 583.65]
MPSSRTLRDPPRIRSAATALGAALARFEKYALVGGDLVVVQGHVSAARRLLRASPNFEVEPRTNCTKYTADGNNVEIQILAAPTLFKERFDETTEVVTLGNVKVLKLALILSSKYKRATDQEDILFLLGYCDQHPEFLPLSGEVPNATAAFVHLCIQQ